MLEVGGNRESATLRNFPRLSWAHAWPWDGQCGGWPLGHCSMYHPLHGCVCKTLSTARKPGLLRNAQHWKATSVCPTRLHMASLHPQLTSIDASSRLTLILGRSHPYQALASFQIVISIWEKKILTFINSNKRFTETYFTKSKEKRT